MVQPRAVVALIAAVGVLLAGCTARPGVAAVVDGEPLRESTLAETVTQLHVFSDAPPRSVLQALVVSPFWREAAAEVGVAASEDEGRAHLDGIFEQAGAREPEGGYATGLLDIARVVVSQEKSVEAGLDGELGALAERLILAATIEVSPRYGEWSSQGITPVARDWFVTPAEPGR